MKQLIIGIDIGASMTKVVALEKLQIVGLKTVTNVDVLDPAQSALKAVLLAADRECEDVLRVAVSGGGARFIGDTLLGLPVVRVEEIKAIGLGGLELSGKQQALVVSMGTGTAMVVASDKGKKIEHIGGTAVGGGVIEGLSRRMLGKSRFEEVEEMASRGNTNNVDTTVDEVEGGAVGILPKEATASNFKKLDVNSDENDVAAAIFNMVSQVIGVITVMAARAYHLEEDVVLVGNLIQSKRIAELINGVAKLFQIKICIPVNGEYCTAIGAAKLII